MSTMQLWLTNADSLPEFTAATDEIRLGFVTFLRTESDMSEYGWVKVGTAEVTPTFLPHEALVQSALASIANEEQKLQASLHVLRERRANLLSLPFHGE